MDYLWESFFNQLFHVAEDAMANRKIPYEDLVDQEPYIYWSLIGATIVKTIENSLEEAKGIRLAAGKVITEHTCPKEHQAMFRLMMQAKENYPSNQYARWTLEQLVLYASSKRKVVTRLSPDELLGLRRLSAEINRISIHISQEKVFRERIEEDLLLLLSLYREV